MVLSPKLAGGAAGLVVLALLGGYFLLWRPGQPPLPITPIQEKTISDLEATNEKLSKERKSLVSQAQANTVKAEQAQTEAARLRGRLKELEAQMRLIEAKRGVLVATPDEALKSLKAMGWLR